MKKGLLSLLISISFMPVFSQVVANFTVTSTTVCVGQSVQFTDLSTGNPTNWNWTFNGGTPGTSNAQNPTVVYNAVGVYNVSLTAGAGFQFDNETKNNYITVIAAPAQPGAISGSAAVCVNQTGTTYSIAPVAGATSYTWSVPGGATITSGQGTNSVTVNWGSTGGNVCVTATNGCGTSAPRCLAVTVNTAPATPGPITGLSAVCANQIGLTYSVTAVAGATSYTWTVPGGVTITAGQGTNAITVNWGATGGNVCVTAGSPCGTSAPSCLTVSVTSGPPATPGTITGPASVCANQTGVTYSTAAVANASGYTWTVPAGATITAGQGTNTITVTYGTTSGNVCVSAFNGCGASANSCLAVTVNLPPAQPGGITGLTAVCSGQTGITYSISPVVGAIAYAWTVPTGATITSGQGTTSIIVTFGSTSGNICVTANNSCPSTPSCAAITVSTPPATPGTITGAAGVCSNQAGVTYSVAPVAGATSYSWTVPTGASITAGQGTTSITVTFSTTSGNVCVVASNACGTSAASCLAVTVNPGAPATPGPVTGLTPVCANQAGVTYSITPVAGASSYTWTVPGGATIASGQGTNSISVNWGFGGGNVCVTATNGCGTSAQSCLAVTMVFAAPAQPGAITGLNTVCAGQTGVSYSVAVVANTSSYTWTVPVGATITSGQGTNSIIVDWGTTGGNVCVTATNGCGTSAPRCLAVTVNTAPATPGPITGLNAVCANQIGLTYSVTAVAGATSYTWTVPGGVTITAGQGTNAITVNWGATGGNVCVTAGSPCGTSAPSCLTVSVTSGPPATPGTITGPASVCANQTGVIYSTAAVANASGYSWTVPAGATITAGQGTNTITVTYGTTSGNVCVSAFNGCGASANSCLAVTVNLPPAQPGGITGLTAVCAGQTGVTYSISPVAGAIAYAWTVPTGATITSGQGTTSIIVTFGSTSGNICVTANNSCPSTPSCAAITVNTPPATPGTITGAAGVCSNQAGVTYSVAPVAGATSYSWTVPTGASITAGQGTTSITVTFSTTSGNVCVVASNACGTSAASCLAVTVNPGAPATPGPVTGLTPVCANQAGVTYSITPVAGATSYTWTVPGGATIASGQGTNSISVNWGFGGGNVCVTATNGCGTSAQSCLAVTMAFAAPAQPGAITGLNTVCAGQTGVSYSVAVVANTSSYTWTVPVGATIASGQGTNIITIDWGTTGGNVCVTATNGCGTSAPRCLAVTVNVAPTVTITPSAAAICSGSSVLLTASGAATYTWSANAGSATTATVSVSPGVTTTYTVTGGNGTCTGTQTVTVNVTTTPTVTATGNFTICVGTTATLTANGASSYTWTPGGSNATVIFVSPPSSVSFTLTGANGSCVSAFTGTLVVTPNPTVTATATGTICAGQSTTLTAGGATTYSWSPAAGLSATTGATVTATPTATTTYSVTGTSGSCTNSATVIVTVNPLPNVSVTPSAPTICTSQSVALTASGASTYSWSPATGLSATTGATVTATPTITTSYTVTGTASTGCVNTATATVTVVPSLTVTVTPGSATVCSGSSVALTASGATNYSWSPAAGLSSTTGSTVTATPTLTTTYTVTGSSGSCSSTATVTVTVNPLPTVSVSPSAATICSGSSTTLTASGASTYSWSPASGLSSTTGASVTANPTITTTYTVTGTATTGCARTATVTVTVNPLPTVSVTPTASTICSGGSVALTASGASTYSWSPAAGLSATTGANVTASPTVTTTYTVTGTATSGCTRTATTTITVNPLPSVSVTPSAPTICTSQSVALTASGASTYSWSPATGLSATTGATVTATPTVSTTYTITGTATTGCVNTTTVSVNVVPSLTVTVAPGTPTICVGSSVSLTASGATNYTWSPAAGLSATTGATVVANPTVTSTYTVTGTSGTCSSTTSVTVTVNPLPTVNATPSTTTSCAGSPVTLTASGASTYSWSPGSGLSSTTGATVTASPTITTTYTVTGTGTNGCSNTATVAMTVNPLPTVSVTPSAPSICSGSSVLLTASGASTYSWSPATGLSSTTGANVTANPTVTTTYTVTGTATTGCVRTATVTVTVNPLPTVSVTPSAPAICFGASVSLTASGASTYSWSPAAGLSSTTGATVTANPTVTTTYMVTGTATSGCTRTATVTVTVNPLPAVNVTPSAPIICTGGAVSLTASGASTYSWSPAAGLSATTGANVTANPTVTSTYVVTGTASTGCVNTSTVTVTVNPLPSVSVTPSAPSICSGASVALTASGASVYSWSPATGLSSTSGATVTANPTVTTSYVVTGTATNGCSNTATVTVNVNPAPTINISPSAPTICLGSAVTLTASGANTYSWIPSTGLSNTTGAVVIAKPTVTTTYTIIGTATNGCTNTATVVVTVNPLPVVSVTPSSSTLCTGGSVSLTASGASIYAWSPGTGLSATTGANVTASPTVSTTYTVTGTATNGCTKDTTVIITVNPVPVITVAPASAVICSGSSVSLTASGASTYSWSPASGLNTTSGASVTANPTVSTTYIVTGTGTNGCSNTTSVTVTVNPLPSISVSPAAPSICSGSSVSLTASGGTTYSWTPATGLSATTGASVTATLTATTSYTVTGTDVNGCTNTSMVTVTIFPVMTLSTSSTNATCGNSNGSASVNVSGGSGPFTYLWNDISAQTTSTAVNLAAGPYNVTVTDNNGCSQIASVAVNNTNGPVLTISGTDVTCFGGNNGSATVTATGGTPGYSYLWNDAFNQTTAIAVNLVSGTYAVTVTDGAGCIGSAIVTINEPSAITLATSSTNATCGNNDGTATVNASGGTPGYTYQWNDAFNQTTTTADSLVAGSYTVTVTDNSGCIQTGSIVVNTTGGPAITLSSTGVSCFGSNNGMASVNVTGGSSPYTYLWSDISAQTTPTASNLTAGVYSVTVTDASGCIATGTVNIATPTAIVVSVSSIGSTCGNNNGSATVAASGGTPGYTYQWNDPFSQTSATATGLSAGAYTVIVTDINGCTQSGSIVINGTNSISVTASSTNVNCFGAGNGTATAIVTGGSTPFNYLWSDISAQTTQTAVNLGPGTYTVTVTDSAGCAASTTAIINEPSAISLTTSAANATCGNSNGSATVNASGGTPAYTYQWNDSFSQTTTTAVNLSAGPYNVTVTDANGCSQVASITVNNTNGPVLTTSTASVNCFGGNSGSATVTVTGGITPYTYLWSNSQTTATATGLTAGNYTITVTDSANCAGFAIVTVNEPPVLALTTSSADATCGSSNGSATVNASGGTPGYTYQWSDPFAQTTATASNLAAGPYNVTVTDANGCSQVVTVTVNNLNGPVLSASSTSVTCFAGNNGTASIVVTGGAAPYTYMWSNSQTTATATGLIAGSYTVTVTDSSNCVGVAVIAVNQPSAISLSTGSTNATCGNSDGSATVNASGGTPGYTYQWSDSFAQTTATATNLAAGPYNVTVTDTNGCTQIASVTVNNLNGPVLTVSTTSVSCFGGTTGSATVNITGGITPYTYLWSNSQTTATASGLIAGNYTVTVTDSASCTGTAVIVISEPTDVILTTSATTAACTSNNGSATVNASGGTPGYTYLWNDPLTQTTATATNLAAGTYTVIVTDINGCSKSVAVTVNSVNSLSLGTTATNVTCFGLTNGNASVAVTGGNAPYSYLWNDGASQTTQTAINLGAGTYVVTVTDSLGCTRIDSVTVTQPTLLTLTTGSSNTTCGNSNGTASATASGGTGPYGFTWNDPFTQQSATAYGLGAGTYTVIVTDSNGCIQTDSATVNSNSTMNISLTLNHVSCFGGNNGTATASVTGGISPYLFVWSNSDSTATATGLQAGTHSVTITDSMGCSETVAAILSQPAPFIVNTSGQGSTCGFNNGSVVVDSMSGGITPFVYTWSNGSSAPAISNIAAGTYILNVKDAQGCVATDTATISNTVTIECVFIPNAFSPNGDGDQDLWVISNLQFYKDVRVEIYNRWGNLVFMADSYNNDWDGRRNGDALPGGVYFYVVDFKDGKKPVSGNLTLIR